MDVTAEDHDLTRMRGVVRLPPAAVQVTDADEEVFLLYTNLAGRKAEDGTSGAFRGLGHINSREDTLTISLNLRRGGGSSSQDATRKTRTRKEDDNSTLDVVIIQDKTALHSRKGDTGSVLWHASVDLAETLLQQLHHNDTGSFLIPELLRNAHVVELGAGTGLLGVVLSPFVRHYTITDIEQLVPLIRKNIAYNLPISEVPSPSRSKSPRASSQPISMDHNVTATALDWLVVQKSPPSLRHRIVLTDPADLLLVVDCIYHPSLLPALVETIDCLTVPGRTAVVIVVELRADDVVRDFLQGWLSKSAEWEIWSVGELLAGPYAVWVGWKKSLDLGEGPLR